MSEFQKFHCCINQKEEEYDSHIQMYFIKEYELASIIARLNDIDSNKSEYNEMINFIKSFENFLITGEKPERFDFLKRLEGEKGWAEDYNIIRGKA